MQYLDTSFSDRRHLAPICLQRIVANMCRVFTVVPQPDVLMTIGIDPCPSIRRTTALIVRAAVAWLSPVFA